LRIVAGSLAGIQPDETRLLLTMFRAFSCFGTSSFRQIADEKKPRTEVRGEVG
jgi:hypothetical protein